MVLEKRKKNGEHERLSRNKARRGKFMALIERWTFSEPRHSHIGWGKEKNIKDSGPNVFGEGVV